MHTNVETTWMITGANGNLGRRMIVALLDNERNAVVAVVRSERAKDALHALNLDSSQSKRLSIHVLDYTDVAALRLAAQGCDKVVHLVGILKQSQQATYLQAHEQSTQALLEALAPTNVGHLTYLSIVGSSADASNLCLASKGRAEELCVQNQLPTCILRVPMVLGEGDYASFALKSRALQRISLSFRAGSIEQPIYAGDVVRAIFTAAIQQVEGALDLAGAEKVTRRELTSLAGRILGTRPSIVSLPISIGLMMASLMERLLKHPPVTRVMLEVLDHDDDIDIEPALVALGGLELTGLNDTLRAVLKD